MADAVAAAAGAAAGAGAAAAARAGMTICWTFLAAVDIFLVFSTAAAAAAGLARLSDVLAAVVHVGAAAGGGVVGVGAGVVGVVAVAGSVVGSDDVGVDDGIQQFFFQMVTPGFELLLLSHRSIELGSEVRKCFLGIAHHLHMIVREPASP